MVPVFSLPHLENDFRYTVRVTAAEAPGGSAYSNYFGGTLMKRNLVVLTKETFFPFELSFSSSSMLKMTIEK